MIPPELAHAPLHRAALAQMEAPLDLSGHLVIPGLINAHDHLEFNLFPALGRRLYPNAGAWARDIYRPAASPLREHLRVPKDVRLWWGALKNLLSGVTTVCHHNPYQAAVFNGAFPVRVVRRFSWAHSLEFEPRLAQRFRRAPAAHPFIVHCAEGVDPAARAELHQLDALGALDARTVIVHGVGIANSGVELMARRGASLVWCPTSNLTMLGRTLSRAILRSAIPIALATDSALSAPVDLLDEFAVARRYLPAARLYAMVSSDAARILHLTDAQQKGDFVAFRTEARSAPDALSEGEVALVAVRGKIRLISPHLARQLPATERRRFQPLHLEGRPPVLVDADVRALRRAATKHLGRDLYLAGKRILP
ncbi:MAG: amidohydrolase family protein [Candidatus Solibacter sp.]